MPSAANLNILLFGASGLVGQAFQRYFRYKEYNLICISATRSKINIDLSSQELYLDSLFILYKPILVINCAACVSIARCQNDFAHALNINANFVKILAKACRQYATFLLHISTDHLYADLTKGYRRESDMESYPNNYSISKKLGELYATENCQSLIIRTNVTGPRSGHEIPTFFEWLCNAIRKSSPISLYDDFFTTTVDSFSLVQYSFDLFLKGATGIYNVASSDCTSKLEFAQILSHKLGKDLSFAKTASINSLLPTRGSCLCLDCSKAEQDLGYSMPSVYQVVSNLLTDRPFAHYNW